MIRKLKSGEYRLYSRKLNPKTGRLPELSPECWIHSLLLHPISYSVPKTIPFTSAILGITRRSPLLQMYNVRFSHFSRVFETHTQPGVRGRFHLTSARVRL